MTPSLLAGPTALAFISWQFDPFPGPSVGHPSHAADAAHSSFVGGDRDGRYLAQLQLHGRSVTERNFSCYAGHGVASWALVSAGMGIGAMLDDLVADEPGIVRVLDEVPSVPVPIRLVTHRELRTTKRIRIVFDLLAQMLAKPLV